MTPERREPLPDDLRETLLSARPEQLRRLLTDILTTPRARSNAPAGKRREAELTEVRYDASADTRLSAANPRLRAPRPQLADGLAAMPAPPR